MRSEREAAAMSPKFQVSLKIRKPVAEVYEAVVDPKKLSGYFVQSSTGPLVEGTTVKWSFAEAPEPFDVIVREVVENERIVLEWPGGHSYITRVEIAFKPLDNGNTMVQISEGGWRLEKDDIQLPCGNAGGWMHMMCSLKGYLDYGINLRAGGAC
jgi:uncharacterized protein YndB with AHSA1/START domain